MLYTGKIERIFEVGVATTYVKDEANSRPVNIGAITLSGGGKSTMLLEQIGGLKGVKALGDITYDGLTKIYLDKIAKKEIRTLILAEFNKIIKRKASTAQNTLGVLNMMCEEGVPTINLPYFQRTWKPPVKCNLILGMTPSLLNNHLIDWWGYGFAQRFLFVTWNYTDEQERQILGYIQKQKHLNIERFSKIYKDTKIELSERLAHKLEPYSIKICKDMTNYVESLYSSRNWEFDRKIERELPFRTQMRLQKFLKALALVNGRKKVTPFELKEFEQLFEFMNLRFNKLK